MRPNGFVLVFSLLFGLLCSSLALAALVLTEMSSQFNQAALTQRQLSLHAQNAGIAALPAPAQRQDLIRCPASFQPWPQGWQRCQLGRDSVATQSATATGQVVIIWQVDLTTQGGEI